MGKKPYETFDIDLLKGKAREDAFAHLLCQSTFEHKRDYWTVRSGNVAFEYEEKRGDELRPSGIAITTANWWVVEFADDCRLVLPVEVCKRLARLAIRDGRHQWVGDGGNHHNAMVPFEWLLKPTLIQLEKADAA